MTGTKISIAIFTGSVSTVINRIPSMYPEIDSSLTPILFWGGIIGIILSATYLIYALASYLMGNNKFSFFQRKIPLKEAAMIVCERTNALDKLAPDTNEKLSLCAYYIIANIPVYGRDPLLSQQKEIKNPASRFGISDDLNGLYLHHKGPEKPEWVDIMVKKSSLNKMIQEMNKSKNGQHMNF